MIKWKLKRIDGIAQIILIQILHYKIYYNKPEQK